MNLKPCPFCGQPDPIEEYQNQWHRVRCRNMICTASQSNGFNSAVEASRFWNTRADALRVVEPGDGKQISFPLSKPEFETLCAGLATLSVCSSNPESADQCRDILRRLIAAYNPFGLGPTFDNLIEEEIIREAARRMGSKNN